jgi:hypothetical protein
MENLTKSQSLMQNVDYAAVISNQIQTITNAGFVPHKVNVTRHIFDKMNREFCLQNSLPEGSVELKKYQGLDLVKQEADSNFNISSIQGYVFPIVVSMVLPAESGCIATSDEDSNEDNE